MNFLDTAFLGNSVGTWLIALGVALGLFAALCVLKRFFHRKLLKLAARSVTDFDDLVAELIGRVSPFFLVAASFYAGSKVPRLAGGVDRVLDKLATVALVFQAVVWGSAVFEYALRRARAGKGEPTPSDDAKYAALGFLFRLLLWSTALLVAMDNLGVKVTTLIAGLGVGGIAAALAVQSILGDLFASLSIVLDKPFVVGDYIVVGDLQGTVEHIGLKTTRVRSLGGEQLVFANSDLLKSRIQNFERMKERRIAFTVGVARGTPADKLERIPGIVREIVEAQERCRFERAHFAAIGDFAFGFETVYYVTEPDFTVYRDVQQAINLGLCRRFREEGVEFAYPRQALYVERGGRGPGGPDAPAVG
ncbi:MAG TPA: mechanosensitive ion channel family protein [Candidatus Aminicenantes bacterium]|nr:mechanosensitive ion channel family protein [Candidatus Aminicenantes bacterium]